MVNWKKIRQWVTFVLNLIVYFAAVNMVTLLFLRLVLSPGSRYAVLIWGLYIVLDAFILYLIARYLFRKIILDLPEKQKERGKMSRCVATALYYLALTIFGGMSLLVGLKLVGGFDLIYAGWPLLLFPVAAAAAVIFGFLRPKREVSDLFVSLVGWAFLLEIPSVPILFLVLVMMPLHFEYRTPVLRPWRYFALSSKMIGKCFPPEAKKCHIRGNQGFGTSYYWSCECPEGAFLRFARKNGYKIQGEDSTNENGRCLKECLSLDMFREIGLERSPESFYYYNDRWPNGGGWTILYDRNSHVLYGNYADR